METAIKPWSRFRPKCRPVDVKRGPNKNFPTGATIFSILVSTLFPFVFLFSLCISVCISRSFTFFLLDHLDRSPLDSVYSHGTTIRPCHDVLQRSSLVEKEAVTPFRLIEVQAGNISRIDVLPELPSSYERAGG